MQKIGNVNIDDSHYSGTDLYSEVERLGREIRRRDAVIQGLNSDVNGLSHKISQLQNEISSLKGSRSWRFTRPLRALGQWARKVKIIKWPIKFLLSLKRVGVKETFKKVGRKIKNKLGIKNTHKKVNINERVRKLSQKEKELFKIYPNAANQIIYLGAYRHIFERVSNPISGEVKFSILVPLYNTDMQMLKEMIESVLIQSYDNFELCLADGSDEKYSYIEKICYEYAKKDKRVVYKQLEEKLGRGCNFNACLNMSTGDYISLFAQNDILHPLVLEKTYAEIQKGADFIYTDECIFSDFLNNITMYNFKSDYAPDTLVSTNYICNFTSFNKSLLDGCSETFITEYDDASNYALILWLTDKTKKIAHIRECLYFGRKHAETLSQSEKTSAGASGRKCVHDFLMSKGFNVEVASLDFSPDIYRLRYQILGQPLVSIIIPNKDNVAILKKCVESILQKSTYTNFEILIIENNSVDKETFEYYDELKNNEKIQIVTWKREFNYSAINNFGVKFAKGDYYLLLNNDTEVIEPNWIEELLMYAQRDDVGVVGAKLLYPDNRVQHAGVILGLIGIKNGVADHAFYNIDMNDHGFMGRASYVLNVSAVTGACFMVRRTVWEKFKGLDEKYVVAYNDVDFCMRVRKAGYLVVYNPFCLLYHHESKSRGYDDSIEKIERFNKEALLFRSAWQNVLDAGDPYYNPNFRLEKGMDYTVREESLLTAEK